MNRRRFIQRGLFGGALLIGGGLTFGLYPSTYNFVPTKWLKVLDERRFAIVAALASRTVLVPGADPVAIAHNIDEKLVSMDPDAVADLLSVLLLLENALAGLLLDGRWGPFTALSPTAQDKVLEAWRDSRFALRRGAYHALRKVTYLGYYSTPASWEGVGYPGPPEIAT